MTDIHTHTCGRNPLDEGSARRRGVYLYNTQHSEEKNIHAADGIRTRSPKCERPQTYALDRAAYGIDVVDNMKEYSYLIC